MVVIFAKIMIFPSLFYFPYKNYIGNLQFYKYNNSSEIPDFVLNNVRLITTNFNTNDNYLFYVSLKTINNTLIGIERKIICLIPTEMYDRNLSFIFLDIKSERVGNAASE